MAKKKKKKKAKIVNLPLSPKQYIKTKARQLPIYECLITEQWKEAAIANIIVSRQHKNGNMTIGVYLVDLLCLGVKDTLWMFNVPHSELEKIKKDYLFEENFIECEYPLVHHIVFGAIDFAKQFEFMPHRDFAVSQYILEKPDDDKIEFIDIEFGEDGIPVLVTTLGEEPKQIITQLEKTAGRGNFRVVYINGDSVEDAFDDEFDQDDFRNWSDEEWQDFLNGEIDLSGEEQGQMIDYLYEMKFGIENEPAAKLNGTDHIVKEFKVTFEPLKKPGRFTSKQEEKEAEELYYLASSEEAKKAIPLLKDKIKQYPNNPIYYNYLVQAYLRSKKFRKTRQLVSDHYEKFPDYLFAKCNYAQYLINRNKFEEVPAVFEHKYELRSLYPERDEFHISEVLGFSSVMCRYFTAIGDLKTADTYFKLMMEFEEIDNSSVEVATLELRLKKWEKLLKEAEAENQTIQENKKSVREHQSSLTL